MFLGPIVVNVLGIKVNVLDRNSSMNLAPSPRVDTFLTFKQNYGNGEENGDFAVVNVPINFVNDMDFNDTNSQKTSII